jgi:hypothetical protein
VNTTEQIRGSALTCRPHLLQPLHFCPRLAVLEASFLARLAPGGPSSLAEFTAELPDRGRRWASRDRRVVILANGRRGPRSGDEGGIIFKVTFVRPVGLALVAGALASGTATAGGNTPQGLKADGLRLQAMAKAYKQMQDRPAASFYTPQALKAEGLRWQAMAEAYEKRYRAVNSRGHGGAAQILTPDHRPESPRADYPGARFEVRGDYDFLNVGSTNGFDWRAAVVGAGSVLGFATVGIALILGARRVRRTKVAV